MATLQKFKLLATQCAVAGSPSRSPTTSPVIHLRRRKTLRMLLSRAGSGGGAGRRLPRREESPDRRRNSNSPEKNKVLAVSHKLKDLFVSSPPIEERATEKVRESDERLFPGSSVAIADVEVRRGGQRSVRPLSATLRQRLLRRAWRPVLVTIPEQP
ncbi:unnamed protein product [Thlaspi arvense]|uniref:Uncharacterized protein n=1 Tax=Thlaspi arvense TaxID=13288 RepID=A0AAU9RW87_THLAR|nr:unnamed protein product [Thlaspi arvense]